MLGWIEGAIHTVYDQSIILKGGSIGYEICVAHALSYTVGQQVTLFLHLHWNQEQGPMLYGFQTCDEKLVFLDLITAPGVGPKLAMAMLDHCGAEMLVQAIFNEDYKSLSEIPGIGKRKAEHLVVQLKQKVAKIIEKGILQTNVPLSELQQVSEVLASLNYTRAEINVALEQCKRDNVHSLDQMLRKALSVLSKSRL